MIASILTPTQPASAGRRGASKPGPRPGRRSDSDLLRRCLAGDERGWRQLVDRYGRLVCATARQCGLGEADAEDVMQIVFTRLYRRLQSLRDHERVASWLITTTRRECWRTSSRNGGPGAPATLPDWEIDARLGAADRSDDGEAVALEQQHLIRQALKQVPARDQRLLNALFFDGRDESYGEIAARLDMRPGSIGPTRARAFKRLEKILIQMGVGPRVERKQAGSSSRGSLGHGGD